MSWKAFIDKVYVVNLQKREDRLLETAKLLEDYEIPYTVFPAIEDREQGARGLRDTMLLIFKDALENNYDNVLVFEDDVDILVSKIEFYDTLNNVVGQIPENYIMCFLGCQITGSVTHFVGSNVLAAQKMFATHAVIYSSQGMKEIIANNFDYPIDNYYVEHIEPMARSFCVFPLLCSQVAGFSDIGGNEISWKPFIEGRYHQKIAEFQGKR